MIHTVDRYHYLYPGGKETLLKSIKTRYMQKHGNRHKTSSYLGAMFRMIKGDKLVVKVSNGNQISSVREENYLGLLKVK